MSPPLVLAEGRALAISALMSPPLVLAHLMMTRAFRHDGAATVMLARLAL